MAATEEELDHLATNNNYHNSMEIIEDDDDCDESDDSNDNINTPKPTKKGPSPKSKISLNKRNSFKLRSLNQSSRNIIKQMDEDNHCCLCSCCNHKCYAYFLSISIVIGSILYALISIITPITGIIGGKSFQKIFEKYSIDEINLVCNDKYDQIFIWNDYSLGIHGFHMFVFGTIDLVFLFGFSTCIISYFLKSTMETDKVCIGMIVVIRLFFMISWIFYGALIINVYIDSNNNCIQNSQFKQEIDDIFIWIIPIFLINFICTAITCLITFISCICCCQIDFRFF